MSKRSRRKFTSTFKARVALEAINETQTLAELAMRFEVASGQITALKRQLTENAAGAFEGAPAGSLVMPSGHELEKLYAERWRMTC